MNYYNNMAGLVGVIELATIVNCTISVSQEALGYSVTLAGVVGGVSLQGSINLTNVSYSGSSSYSNS